MSSYDLETRGTESKYRYLHRCIRDDIRSGKLAAGVRLPSKRSLAQELGVSIATIEHAYGLLVSEGYLEVKQGSGFVVCCGRSDSMSFNCSGKHKIKSDLTEKENDLTGNRSSTNAAKDAESPIDLKANSCSLELFPLHTWSRLMRQVLSENNPDLLKTVPFNGLYALRKAIAQYLYEVKGIVVSPERIIVGLGQNISTEDSCSF